MKRKLEQLDNNEDAKQQDAKKQKQTHHHSSHSLYSISTDAMVIIFQFLTQQDLMRRAQFICKHFENILFSHAQCWKFVHFSASTAHIPDRYKSIIYCLFNPWRGNDSFELVRNVRIANNVDFAILRQCANTLQKLTLRTAVLDMVLFPNLTSLTLVSELQIVNFDMLPALKVLHLCAEASEQTLAYLKNGKHCLEELLLKGEHSKPIPISSDMFPHLKTLNVVQNTASFTKPLPFVDSLTIFCAAETDISMYWELFPNITSLDVSGTIDDNYFNWHKWPKLWKLSTVKHPFSATVPKNITHISLCTLENVSLRSFMYITHLNIRADMSWEACGKLTSFVSNHMNMQQAMITLLTIENYQHQAERISSTFIFPPPCMHFDVAHASRGNLNWKELCVTELLARHTEMDISSMSEQNLKTFTLAEGNAILTAIAVQVLESYFYSVPQWYTQHWRNMAKKQNQDTTLSVLQKVLK